MGVIWLVWGSTYLAIRIAVLQLPPVLFAGARFALAGVLMFVYAWLRGARLPRSRVDWQRIAVSGFALLVAGNGLVTWSEQTVESNQAALIVATSALWIAGFGVLGASGERVTPLTLAGLLLGFAGVAVLVGSGITARLAPVSAYCALLLAPLMWSAGSIYSRRHPVSVAPAMTAALQMCISGVVLGALGFSLGEAPRWHAQPQAYAALAYLVVFGSCVAYGAYYWLVHEVTPATLGTYAYVNPAVAVLLGGWLLDERLTTAQVWGTVIILSGVVLVTLSARRRSGAAK
ncbi:MAG TPA: EamA family transporter [Nevskiaceae bacterium]|nr:EamA family transporter [Nevskiaceae bacterium]